MTVYDVLGVVPQDCRIHMLDDGLPGHQWWLDKAVARRQAVFTRAMFIHVPVVRLGPYDRRPGERRAVDAVCDFESMIKANIAAVARLVSMVRCEGVDDPDVFHQDWVEAMFLLPLLVYEFQPFDGPDWNKLLELLSGLELPKGSCHEPVDYQE